MEAKAVQKFIKMGPRKLRLVADSVRSLTPSRALEVLPFVTKRAASPIAKVIGTAMANARVKNMDETRLIFKTLEINEGPRLKRFRAVSRGRAHSYIRQMSHIKVVLTTNDQVPMNNDQKKAKTQKVEKKVTEKVETKKVRKTKKTEN